MKGSGNFRIQSSRCIFLLRTVASVYYMISISITSSTIGSGTVSFEDFCFGDLMSFLIDPKTPFFLVLLKAPPARPAVSELLERLRAGRARGVAALLGPLDLLVNAGDSFLVLLLWLSREVIFRGNVLGVTGAFVPRCTGLVLFLFLLRGGSAGGASGAQAVLARPCF